MPFTPTTAAASQAILRQVAERHGYLASRGPHAGCGNPSALIQALGEGEVATVLLGDEERWLVIEWLAEQAGTVDDGCLAAGLRSLAKQLLIGILTVKENEDAK